MTRHYIANNYLSPDIIDASIDEVHRLARLDRQSVALAGGIAMQVYGSDRFTGDIDVIAEAPIPGIRAEQELALISGYSGRLPNGVQVDVIVPEAGTEWYDLFEHARLEARVQGDDELGHRMPVVTREYMVALKMMAGREKDLGDLYYLLTDINTDLALARRVVRTEMGKYAAQEFDQLVEEARWAAGQKRGRR